VTLKPGLEVTQGHRIWCHSIRHPWIPINNSNHRPISHRVRDKRRFLSKINFSHPRVFNVPAEGVSVGIGYRREGSKTRMMGLSQGRNSFKIGLAFKTQYRHVVTLRYSTCKYTVTLKSRLGATQGQRNRHVSIRHLWLPINVP